MGWYVHGNHEAEAPFSVVTCTLGVLVPHGEARVVVPLVERHAAVKAAAPASAAAWPGDTSKNARKNSWSVIGVLFDR